MKLLQIAIPALFLFLLWLLLSGHFDPFHITLGIFSVALVMVLSWKISVFSSWESGSDVWSCLYESVQWKYGIIYPFILLWSIIKANIHVAALVLDPKMRIDPILMRFPTTYDSDAAKIVMGNSITLTPGTITLDIREKEFYVHALSPALASSLMDGSDQNRVADVFGEAKLGRDFKVFITRKIEEL